MTELLASPNVRIVRKVGGTSVARRARHVSEDEPSLIVVSVVVLAIELAAATLGGTLPHRFRSFPPTTGGTSTSRAAPVDPARRSYISFINNGRRGGCIRTSAATRRRAASDIYGFPYVVVDGTQPKRTVQFLYSDESDGVNHTTDQSYPFYPIPDEAITQPHWIEGGEPGNVDRRSRRRSPPAHRRSRQPASVRAVQRLLRRRVVARRLRRVLRPDANDRRPDGWTSADAAGLAILPGLVRYDEVFGAGEITHAFRVTVRATNGYVYPGVSSRGSTPARCRWAPASAEGRA